MSEPLCVRPDCDEPNHCPVCSVHHPVDSMTRWCVEHEACNRIDDTEE